MHQKPTDIYSLHIFIKDSSEISFQRFDLICTIFDFTIMHNPGSKNVKAVAPSYLYPSDSKSTINDSILQESCWIPAISCNIHHQITLASK